MRAFGIIGGGAALAFASVLGVLGPIAGVGAVGNIRTILICIYYTYHIITGAVGLGGSMVAQAMCFTPYCRAVGGQCCLLTGDVNGLVCPDTC